MKMNSAVLMTQWKSATQLELAMACILVLTWKILGNSQWGGFQSFSFNKNQQEIQIKKFL